MSHKLDGADGRVVLWHGPSGTGKTTAIRALALAWQEQARFQVVLDPETVFTSSSRMLSVILGDANESEQWRVLVIEDADNLVANESHDTHVLSRLLNVGDGIVGQGLRVLVLLTTNKPPAQLHPALTRPGRCLAHTNFRRFTRREAVESFGPDVADRAEITLAELLNKGETSSDAAPIGLYL